MEVMDYNIYSGNDLLHIVLIYRPPYSKAHKITLKTFLCEFGSLMESAMTSAGRLIVAGDMNIHVDDTNNTEGRQFIDLFTSLGLVQHVVGPTHTIGHTLDLVLTRAEDVCVTNFVIDRSLPSDHAGVHFTSTVHRPPLTKIFKEHRSLADLDITSLKDTIESTLSDQNDNLDVNVITKQYNVALNSAIDDHAPMRKKSVVVKPRARWLTMDLIEERRLLRKHERKMISSGLIIHSEIFKATSRVYNKKLNNVKTIFHQNQIAEADSKQLFAIIDDISGNKKSTASVIPDTDPTLLPDVFADFFTNKIKIIRTNLSSVPDTTTFSNSSQTRSLSSNFNSFNPLCVNEIVTLVRKMPSKTCSIDPMPTNLVKECIEVLAPTLLRIVNTSFQTGVFPESCKRAIVRPLIKKLGLDKEILKNYRPVSNCTFLDKFLEKAALAQLHHYFKENHLYGKFQSAYREGHSTETALLRVANDTLRALDKKQDLILILLDLSAAFDTIDHTILLRRLQFYFGITDSALDWLSSYLTGRTQQVAVGSYLSEEHTLQYGVPQGSVLGPVLFSLYMAPLEDIITKHGLNSVIYADDTQLYIACDSRTDHSVLNRIESCVDEIRSWMRTNMLALNDSKTEVICFSPKSKNTSRDSSNCSVRIGDAIVTAVNSVRNLGITMDSSGTMDTHITNVCKSASHSLWRIGKLRKFLNQSNTEKLIHAFVSSRLDYCNSLFYGSYKYQFNKLQHIQNAAARIVLRRPLPRGTDMTTILKELHWLPIEARIEFKVLCLIFKVIHYPKNAPFYLLELIDIYKPTRTLRSDDGTKFNYPTIRPQPSRAYGDRAFSVFAPRIWNSMPYSLRAIDKFNSFKSDLKTYLFRKYLL
ncbi:hypothetical protein SNE40_002900 [Patella caerulea]|uniref:Reverse transcriptase domain-containing protein n=1 Tax=Patella caerulea TaxID=87958 RepID=A0AAN8K6U5_PATCE